MNILSIGQFSAYDISNTCLHRNWALQKLGTVSEIDSTYKGLDIIYRIVNFLFVKVDLPVSLPFLSLNKRIKKCISTNKYDCVWIDKGIYISRKTLKYIKQIQPDCKLIGYSPDNMAERHNQSLFFLESLPLYDYFITTKSYIVDQLKSLGAQNVIFVNNAYESTFHKPIEVTDEERIRYGGKVGFIGMWEQERCNSIIYLAENGIPVRVWGGGKWLEYKNKFKNLTIEDSGLFSYDYIKALSSFDISLCFLRKINNDQQTTRTMEIPACKSLLMAERTAEHMALFKDNKEAAFFSSDEELLDKCRYYLAHPKVLHEVQEAGYARCVSSGYSNYDMVRKCFYQIGLK